MNLIDVTVAVNFTIAVCFVQGSVHWLSAWNRLKGREDCPAIDGEGYQFVLQSMAEGGVLNYETGVMSLTDAARLNVDIVAAGQAIEKLWP